MGNTSGDSATPLSAILFKTVLVGVAVGVVLSVTLYLLPIGGAAPLDVGTLPLVFLSGASLGARLGGGSAACSLGLHSLARKISSALWATAAGIGGAVGVLLPPLLLLGPALFTSAARWWLPVCVLAGTAWAVVATRPLRAPVLHSSEEATR
jgi:hypothetical protein